MLNRLISEIKTYEGLTRKKEIRNVKMLERTLQWGGLYGFGDDAAVLKMGDEYLLLACDGIWSQLEVDPFWMGFCAVLVNVNDIYAMGGIPLAMVNVVSAEEGADELLKGIAEGCEKFRVPMVGGHIHPDAPTSVAVAIVGKAKKVLTSFDARPREKVVLAMDLQGRQYKNFLNWDSTSMKSSEEVLYRLEALPLIAEKGLATSCKDISNPGLLGTLGMLLETSKVGAVVKLDEIPIPPSVEFLQFLKMYPGYGFLLTAEEERVGEIIAIFEERDLSAGVIGEITTEREMILHHRDEIGVLFDFKEEIICGL